MESKITTTLFFGSCLDHLS